jgi:hypothetical protein
MHFWKTWQDLPADSLEQALWKYVPIGLQSQRFETRAHRAIIGVLLCHPVKE